METVTEARSIAIVGPNRGFPKRQVLTRTGTPHVFLPIADSPAPEELHANFTAFISGDVDAYKPVPVIHSLSSATSLSRSKATDSMDEWVTLADASGRNIPILWIGPNAAGHLQPPGQILTQGNGALWNYTLETMREARAMQLDALGMYNLTLQANSWDGSNYGQKVGLVQAMMVKHSFLSLCPQLYGRSTVNNHSGYQLVV